MNDPFAAKQRVDQALEALRISLTPYVEERMRGRFGPHWRHYASRAVGAETGKALDAHALLKTILDNYGEVFRNDPAIRRRRSYLSLAMDARNAVSHFDGFMQDREALRYLDAVREVLTAVGAKKQIGIVDELYEAQKSANPEAEKQKGQPDQAIEEPPAPTKLRPWREVAQPHPDVLEARFTEAEFAANLAHVDQGIGSEEYTDPMAFYRITYLTDGLANVLRKAAQRFAKTGGDPIVGLQTNFGGGKTHTMLALYHLAGAVGAGYNPKTLYGVRDVLEAAGLSDLPRVQRAVFVGTHKGPHEVMHQGDGRDVRTLWGYIAYRLGGWTAVDHIAESEAHGTNPGSEKLIQILEAAAPCLILLDEVVAFAKQLRGEQYEAFHAFIQSLTEAAAAVPGAMVVGSLPESGMEVGDEAGRDALHRLEKLFGRIQSSWTPATGLETFEIVRRRLFQPLDDEGEKARDNSVQAFSKLYRDNPNDFPREVREPAYREEMKRAYPIHPEVLKRFSEDWSTLERFQRTRGILRIMANAIYALWRGESAAPLITLGMLPLADDKLRTAILEPLDPAYSAILQSEVDGDQALPAKLEAQRSRFGKMKAATRAARAVFLTTAPHRGAAQGRITRPRLMLACAQPGDQISVFGDALGAMAEQAAYLYQEGERYWFSTQPTLNRIADDRAQDTSTSDADREIVQLLEQERRHKGGFHRIHAAPQNPIDVEDARGVALVILSPDYPHMAKSSDTTPAQRIVTDTLQRRGSGQRHYRNTLIFMAADENGLDTCRQLARKHKAWQSIVDDGDLTKELTVSQFQDAKKRVEQSRESLAQRVRTTWSHALYPEAAHDGSDGSGPALGFSLGHTSVTNRAPGKPIAEAAYNKLTTASVIVERLGPETLTTELRKVWGQDQPHIEVATVLDWFAKFVYLPRVRDDATVTGAMEELIRNLDAPIAFAQRFDEQAGHYEGVSVWSNTVPGNIAQGLLVWRHALPEQDDSKTDPGASQSPEPERGEKTRLGPASGDGDGTKERRLRRFYGSIPLDPDQAGLQAAKLAQDILFELSRPRGAQVTLTLDIEASAPDGYPDDVVEVVNANLKDLKMDSSNVGFEEE